MMKGEDDKKDEVHQTGDDECQETKFERDFRRLEEKRRHEEEDRDRVAPDMGWWLMHPAHVGLGRRREEHEEFHGQQRRTMVRM